MFCQSQPKYTYNNNDNNINEKKNNVIIKSRWWFLWWFLFRLCECARFYPILVSCFIVRKLLAWNSGWQKKVLFYRFCYSRAHLRSFKWHFQYPTPTRRILIFHVVFFRQLKWNKEKSEENNLVLKLTQITLEITNKVISKERETEIDLWLLWVEKLKQLLWIFVFEKKYSVMIYVRPLFSTVENIKLSIDTQTTSYEPLFRRYIWSRHVQRHTSKKFLIVYTFSHPIQRCVQRHIWVNDPIT